MSRQGRTRTDSLSAGRRVALAVLAWCLTGAVHAAVSEPAEAELFDLSLDDLLDLEVTTVSRQAESSRSTASAVYVITGEDLRRNQVTHLAEALRMVPGMHVARIDANRWAVNIRGSTSYFANRLLVQMDGRTLYSPVFSGTFWNVQDTLLEDVERIEVIRGPGAVMWGANAVNGVVNIITKSAAKTASTLVTAQLGTEDSIAQYRHGGALNEDWHGRFYVRTRDTDEMRQLEGGDNNDDWWLQQAGFRLDGGAGDIDSFTLQGDLYRGKESVRGLFPKFPPFPPDPNNGIDTFLDHNDIDLRGFNLIGRWTRKISEDEELQVQAYYDHTVRNTAGVIDIQLDIYDVEVQHVLAPVAGHGLIWGGAFRLVQDHFSNGGNLFFYTPAQTSRQRWSAFFQYDLPLIPDQLNLIVGSKFEDNDYTGYEYQPTAKLLWRATENQTAWLSWARAVRTPDRSEHDINLALNDGSELAFAQLIPAPDTHSEVLYSLDLGHRFRLRENLSWDIVLFDKRLADELGVVVSPTPQFPAFTAPFAYFPAQNFNRRGENHWGGELVLDWQPRDWWQVQAWWAHIQPKYADSSLSRNHANIRSYMNLPEGFELDGTVRYVDARTSANIPSYVELDLRFGWHINPELELSLGLSHLLDNETVEAPVQSFIRFQQTEIQRAASLKLTWTPGGR